MDKKVYRVIALAFVVIALASFGVYARSMLGESQSLSCDRTDLIGAVVKNSKGDVIGIVNNVEDYGGQSFAIIKHSESHFDEGGMYTPVPAGALKIAESDQEKYSHLKTVILNRTEKELEASPSWDPAKMNDRKYQALIGVYFGTPPSLCS
jgi:hypothetical protein